MKHITLLIALLISTFSFAQEDPKITPFKDGEEELAFMVIEHVPVHANCNESLSNQALKECMNNEMRQLIIKNFNVDLANDLNLPSGKNRINTLFSINKEGLVDNIRVRASHPALEIEAKRLINLIPQFKRPGMQKGQPISVTFALPIHFMVEGNTQAAPIKPLTKKEQKKMARDAKKLAKKIKKQLRKASKDKK